MKVIRWAAVVVLVLMSLMNVGTILGGDDAPPVAVVVGAVVLGLLGFVAAFGLARGLAWGRPAALAIGVINLIAAAIALAVGSDGAVIGLVVSALIVVLSFFATDAVAGRTPAKAALR
jgi:hypothetical protein